MLLHISRFFDHPEKRTPGEVEHGQSTPIDRVNEYTRSRSLNWSFRKIDARSVTALDFPLPRVSLRVVWGGCDAFGSAVFEVPWCWSPVSSGAGNLQMWSLCVLNDTGQVSPYED